MKKILITIIILLLLILICIGFARGINLGFIKLYSMGNIQEANKELNSSFDTANELVNITYEDQVGSLEEAIKKLKVYKQNYETKNAYAQSSESISTVQIKTYTIHYLWTIIGNYKKDAGLESLTLDLKSSGSKDVYNLDFTVLGTYIGITDFLYNLENDTDLNFEIKNLKITSEITNVAQNTTQNNDKTQTVDNKNTENNTNTTPNVTTNIPNGKNGTIIQATFSVNNIGIILE